MIIKDKILSKILIIRFIDNIAKSFNVKMNQNEKDPRYIDVEIYMDQKDGKMFSKINDFKYFKKYIKKYFPPIAIKHGGPIYDVKSSFALSDKEKIYFKLVVNYFNPNVVKEHITCEDKYIRMRQTFEEMKNAIFELVVDECDEDTKMTDNVINAINVLDDYFEYYRKNNNIEIENSENKNDVEISKE